MSLHIINFYWSNTHLAVEDLEWTDITQLEVDYNSDCFFVTIEILTERSKVQVKYLITITKYLNVLHECSNLPCICIISPNRLGL